MKTSIFIAVGLMVMVLINFTSCNKDSIDDECCNKDSIDDGYGTLKVKITDAPFPIEFIEEANITITKVEIRKKDNLSDEYPFITIYEDTITYNLLELRNGIMADLPGFDVQAGNYDLIRIYVDEASISIKDYGTYDLKVPSGAQSGIKVFIDPDLKIVGGLTTELLLDFNLDKSFVLKGNINTPAGIKGFNFKPVIRAVNNSTAGLVQGIVKDTASAVLPNAQVWIAADTTISTAYTDSAGFYALPGIPEGFYSMYVTKENYDTVMISDVEIVAANLTIKDFELTPKN